MSFRSSHICKVQTYRKIRLVLKAWLVKTVVDNLCNSAQLAKEDSIGGTGCAMDDDKSYMWLYSGFSSSHVFLPFSCLLAAPSDMLCGWPVIQKAWLAGPAVDVKFGGPSVFRMRDTSMFSISMIPAANSKSLAEITHGMSVQLRAMESGLLGS